MPRKKLPAEQVMVTSGIKLPKWAIRELESLGEAWGCAPSAAGRALLLFGLDMFRATQASRIFTQYLNGQAEDPDDLPDEFEIAPFEEKDDEPLPLNRKGGR